MNKKHIKCKICDNEVSYNEHEEYYYCPNGHYSFVYDKNEDSLKIEEYRLEKLKPYIININYIRKESRIYDNRSLASAVRIKFIIDVNNLTLNKIKNYILYS